MAMNHVRVRMGLALDYTEKWSTTFREGGVNRWAQRILWDDPGTDTGGCGCVGT